MGKYCQISLFLGVCQAPSAPATVPQGQSWITKLLHLLSLCSSYCPSGTVAGAQSWKPQSQLWGRPQGRSYGGRLWRYKKWWNLSQGPRTVFQDRPQCENSSQGLSLHRRRSLIKRQQLLAFHLWRPITWLEFTKVIEDVTNTNKSDWGFDLWTKQVKLTIQVMMNITWIWSWIWKEVKIWILAL